MTLLNTSDLPLEHLKEYDTLSYRTLQELARDPYSGVKIRNAIDYYDFNPTGHEGRSPWWSGIVEDVRSEVDFWSRRPSALSICPNLSVYLNGMRY